MEAVIYNFSGLSTDTKPTVAAGNNMPNGSRWREVDTGKVWYFNASDSTWYLHPPAIDSMTHAAITITYGHHEVHAGSSFTANYSRVTAATNGVRSGLYIKTPAAGGKLCHLIVSVSAATAATFSMLEAPTIAANTGSHGLVIYNRYRDSTTASGCFDNATAPVVNKFTTLTEAQIFGDGTWATGTVLRTEPLTLGSGPKPIGGDTRATEEYILKANTKYVFLLTNTAASANTHTILIDWYEHTNKV